jgi:DNA-binding beta-propeller fold protein YncE
MRLFTTLLLLAISFPAAMAQADCSQPSVATWGTPGTGSSNFINPWGVAIGPDGFVYVTDEGNDRIQKFTLAGVYVGEWSTGFQTSPVGIAIDPSGVMYVALHHIHQIAEYSLSGTLLGTFGSSAPGPAQLLYPVGVALGGGKIYVASSSSDRLQVFNPDGSYAGGWAVPFPYGVQVDAAGNVYVSSYSTWLVYETTFNGNPIATIGSAGSGDGQFYYPVSMAFDPSGNLYVIDGDNDRVQEFSGGAFVCKWGTSGSSAGQLSHPTGIALGPNGSVYVCEWANDRIQLFANMPVPTRSETWGHLKASYR